MNQYVKSCLLVFVIILTVSCMSTQSVPTLPIPRIDIEPALFDSGITSNNASSLIEVAQLSSENAGPIAALTFTSDMEELLAVHAKEGVLRRWRLAGGVLSQAFDVYPIEFGAVAFDVDRSLLATGAGVEWEKYKKEDEYLGIRIWNTQTGQLVLRAGEGYDASSGPLTRSLMLDVALQPNGDWVLVIDASADVALEGFKEVHMYEVVTGRIGNLLVNLTSRKEEDDFDVIAFDAQGEFYAAANEAGKVAIYRFNPPHYSEQEQALLERAEDSLGPTPLALAFDPTRHWLAGIRGTALIVWDLQSLSYPHQIEAQISRVPGLTASLAFDPSGKLLAVGTIDGWQIWDVESRQLLLQGSEAGVYAVTFSPDGWLFAWGDAAGVVHIWGVPDS
jgi:WD40 repeat protein